MNGIRILLNSNANQARRFHHCISKNSFTTRNICEQVIITTCPYQVLSLMTYTNLSSPKNNGLIAIYLCLAITVSSCLWSTVHCFVTKAETLQISMLHSALHSAAAKFPRHCALGFSILSVYFRGSLVSESIDMWCNTIRWSVKLMMSYTVQEKNLYFNTRPILQLAEAELAAIVQYLQLFI